MPEIREDEGRQPLAPPVPYVEPPPPVTSSDLGEPGSIEQRPLTAPDTGAGTTPPAPVEPPVVSPPPPTAPEVSVAAAKFNPPPPTEVYAVAHQYLTPDELNYDKNRILQILHDKGAPLDTQLEYARLNISELGPSEKLIRELNTEAEVRFGQNQFLNDINFAKAQRAFQSSHVQLGDGQWVDKAAFDALPFQYREIGLAKGIEAINDKLAEDGRLAEGEAERYEGESRLAVRSQAEYDKAQAEYAKSVDDWIAGQVATGAAKDRADAERQLTEIQSGQYKAWMPDPADPEDVSKGQYVPVWSDIVAAREQAGLSAQQLGEIYSGKYTVRDPVTGVVSPTTKEAAQARQKFEDWINTQAPESLRTAYHTGGDEAYEKAAAEITAAYEKSLKERQAATSSLARAGFTAAEYPSGGAPFESYGSSSKQMTVPGLARFVRDSPTGLQSLRDYGFPDEVINSVTGYNDRLSKVTNQIEDLLAARNGQPGAILALTTAIGNAGYYDPQRLSASLRSVGGGTPLWVDNETGRVLTQREIADRQWNTLVPEQKNEVAVLWDADYQKGSYFAELNRVVEDVAQRGGIVGQVLYSPVLPITTPIAKQVTIKAAREALANEYQPVLQALKGYVRGDGSIDAARLRSDLTTDPKLANSLLASTGYGSVDDLKSNVDFYNLATRGVTPLEWTQAGLVAAADAIMMGGGALLPTTGLAGLFAKGGQLALGPAIGTAYLPDTLKAVTSPVVGGGQKALAIGAAAAAFVPPLIGPAMRGLQFAHVTAHPSYVPLRSLSMEASTARVPFTPSQLTKLRKAGITETDIIRAGTEINQQLVGGAKTASVNLGGVVVRVRNVPYQRSIGLSLFQGTPDITLLDRGGSVPVIKDFYSAAKVAIEPMRRSYLEGTRATSPGIVEIRIADPELIGRIMPQRRLISGGTTLEPEAVLPSLNELQGMGYRLEPIPGRVGRGITFDASLGPVQIRRYTLSKVVDNPSGLIRVRTGASGSGGVVAVGDLHGTTDAARVFDDINSSFSEPVLRGDPGKTATWHWNPSVNQGRAVVVMGDSIDRGPAYAQWRDTFNRLYEEARQSGDRLERLLGNHELAYLSDDAIKGIEYTDAQRAVIKGGILEDIAAGKVKAAIDADGKLFTHAGVSRGVFPEFTGRTPAYVAQRLNQVLLQAVKQNKFGDKMFAKGRVEKGHSLSKNERSQGGVFWLRPQEARVQQLDLGFTQVVGHNPGFGVRRIWGKNFIETDVGRRSGGSGVYADTPYVSSVPADIITSPVGGEAARLSTRVMTGLKLRAMRDTVADVFLGWDGRVQAVENLKRSEVAVKALLDDLDQQIEVRRVAGDSVGVKYLKRQKQELISPTGRDYLYGGLSFWRDIVAGRQNSVRVLDRAVATTSADLARAISYLTSVRSTIDRLPDADVQRFFGTDRQQIVSALDTTGLTKTATDDVTRRLELNNKLRSLVRIVDAGLENSIAPYLNQEKLADSYESNLRSLTERLSAADEPYDTVDVPVETYREQYGGLEREPEPITDEAAAPRLTERSTQAAAGTRRAATGEPAEGRTLGVVRGVTPATYASDRSSQLVSRLPYLPTPGDVRLPSSRPPLDESLPPSRLPREAPPVGTRPPTIGVRPPPPPPPGRPPAPPVPTPPPSPIPPEPESGLMLPTKAGSGGGSRRLPPGAVTWRQGMFWKYIPPPFDQPKPITLPRGVTPEGATNTELITPQETIQMIGRSGAAVPEQFNIDLGVVDIYVRDNGKSIEYRGKGEGTDVGTRLSSPTQGMDLDGEGDTLDIGYGELPSKTRRVKATKQPRRPQRKTQHKRRREDDYSDLLSVKGVRF